MNGIRVGSGDFQYTVDESWAKFPAMGEAGEAVGVACDSKDRVYVFLRGPKPVLVFERDGTPLGDWGETEFTRPHGIFIGNDDTVYCSDDFGHCVRVFTLGEPGGASPRKKMTLGTPGKPSDTGATSIDYRTIQHSGPPFNFPTNLAIGPTGDLFVSDGYGNARIHRSTADGRLLHSWGVPGNEPGQFHVPHGIAVDAAGTVYVADRENCRVQLFTSDGDFAGEWTDFARPCQMYIDRAGWIYVAELGFRAGRWPGTGTHRPGQTGGRVSILDRAGKLHTRFGGGENPCAPGDFFAPHGIWVDSRGDLYVSEVALAGGAKAGLVDGSCHTLQKFVRN